MSKILMRSVVVACLFVLLAPLSAFAQYGTSSGSKKDDDFVTRLKRENSLSWNGFSVGVNGGIGWGTSQFIETVSSDRYGINGGMFGVGAAYIMQYGRSPVHGGIAVDFDWANLHGTASQNCLGCETKVTSFSTLRYVLGYGYPMGPVNCYPYVTGGLAVANAQANVPGFPGVSAVKAGWTVGGGAELQFHKDWSVKAEYLYSDLGSLDWRGIASVPVKVQTVRFGLNYHFIAEQYLK